MDMNIDDLNGTESLDELEAMLEAIEREPDAELEGKAAKWQAEAQRIAKLTDSIRFEDALKQAQTGKTLQEMEQLAAQQQAMQTEQAALQAQLLESIQQQIDAIAL